MLCTLVLEAGHKVQYESILNQNWEGFELLYTHPKTAKNNQSETALLQQHFCKSVAVDPQNQWSEILKESRGSYIAWVHPNELWDTNFLDIVREQLTLIQNDYTKTSAGYGFINNNNSLTFLVDTFPSLLEKNTLPRNIPTPKYYTPYIKYFFDSNIIRSQSLSVDYSVESWQERYAIFCFKYCIAIRSITGGYESSFQDFTAPFSLPASTFLDTKEYREYQRTIRLFENELQSSPFESIFWTLLFFNTATKLKNVVHKLSNTTTHVDNN
jgi:hypothetical protein